MKLAMSTRPGHIVLLIERNITTMVNAPVILMTPLTLTIGRAISYGGASPLKGHPSKDHVRALLQHHPNQVDLRRLCVIYFVCKMYLSVIMSSLCINNAAKSRVAMSPQLYFICHHGILRYSIAATAEVTPCGRRMSDCHTCLNICVYVIAKAW